MEARLLPMGEDAVLVEVAGTPEAVALRDAVRERVDASGPRDGAWSRVVDVVGAARTVLVRAQSADLDAVGRAVLDLAATLSAEGDGDASAAAERVVEIVVRYDGADLDEVGRLTGLGREGVVAAHTGTPWRVGFGGFAPGFAYLVGGDPRLEVPRRAEPRSRVPSGSVALAGPFSGVYPQESPGGWQVVGRTDAVLFDVDREPPALLRPGTTVRFVDAATRTDAPPAGHPSDASPTPRASASSPSSPSSPSSTGPGLVGPVAGRALEVLRSGPLALVEDAGRSGLADLGVPRSGAADRAAYLLGLRLVGHEVGTAAEGVGAQASGGDARRAPASLEVLLGGLAVRAHGDLVVAVTGAPAPARVDGRPVGHAAPVPLRDGQVLELGTPPAGLRSYVAVRGGVDVPAVLGSRSTDTLSGLGPAPVCGGDVLPVGPAPREFPVVDAAPASAAGAAATDVTLALVPGPRAAWCRLDDLVAAPFTVSARSNRVGIRLQGNEIQRTEAYRGRELASEPMVRGAVQVPPGGEPVVFLADHPVSGGYPVVAVVAEADVDRAAQLRPGDRVSLRWQSRNGPPPGPGV